MAYPLLVNSSNLSAFVQYSNTATFNLAGIGIWLTILIILITAGSKGNWKSGFLVGGFLICIFSAFMRAFELINDTMFFLSVFILLIVLIYFYFQD